MELAWRMEEGTVGATDAEEWAARNIETLLTAVASPAGGEEARRVIRCGVRVGIHL